MATQEAPYTASSAAQHILDNAESLLGIPDDPEKVSQPESADEATPHEPESEPEKAAEGEDAVAEDKEVESGDDEPDDSVPLNLDNLARHLGVDVESLYDLSVPTKVNGEDGEITLADLRKSYQLESAINQKSMKLSDELKATESEREQIRQEREIYQSQLSPFIQQLSQMVQSDRQVDWERLAKEDPQAYLTEKAQADQRRQALEASQQQYQHMQAQQLQEHLQRESQRLPEVIPEWSDPSVKEAESKNITEYMRNHGYSDQDIQSISYGKSEWIATIRKAMLYDKASTNIETKKKAADAPKLKLKSGAARSKKEDQAEQRKSKLGKVRKTGKVNDAAAAIYDLI